MLHVQEEARDAGVEIPQNFERIDSLDKIFSPTVGYSYTFLLTFYFTILNL
jgi:hypothetical protein